MISDIHAFSAYAVYSQNGTWSLWSLVLVFLICSASFCLAFAVVIMALAGRFGRKPPQNEGPPPANGPWRQSAFEETLIENGVPVPRPGKPENETGPEAGQPSQTSPPPAARKPTGLWQLLASAAIFVPSMAFFSLMDRTLGAMVYFNGGTVVQIVLLAAQAILAVWGVRLQRRRR